MPRSSPESVIQSTESIRCSCNRCRAHDTGERGPYSPQDFLHLFGVANEPAPVEVPVELATLGIAVDVARDRYEAARGDWSRAHHSLAVAESAQSRHTGTPSLSERQAVEAALDEMGVAKHELDEAGVALGLAQVAYNTLGRRLQDEATASAYVADQAAQAAQREAAREQVRSASQRRGLRALRAKVSGITA